jgi:hypothetical protein
MNVIYGIKWFILLCYSILPGFVFVGNILQQIFSYLLNVDIPMERQASNHLNWFALNEREETVECWNEYVTKIKLLLLFVHIGPQFSSN